MNINSDDLEVYFHEYCDKCKHKDIDEVKDPCNACLDMPYNHQSHKPICFEKEE